MSGASPVTFTVVFSFAISSATFTVTGGPNRTVTARISFRKPSRVTVSDRPGARKKKIHALSIGFRRVNRALGVVLDRHTCTGSNRTARIGHDPVSKSVADGQSGQAYASEKIFKAFMRAVSVKNRIDGEISHPNRVIVIGRLQPL
jgi:hypothetical protein